MFNNYYQTTELSKQLGMNSIGKIKGNDCFPIWTIKKIKKGKFDIFSCLALLLYKVYETGISCSLMNLSSPLVFTGQNI